MIRELQVILSSICAMKQKILEDDPELSEETVYEIMDAIIKIFCGFIEVKIKV